MRCSATEVDAYRYWRDTEDSSLDDLLTRLRRQGEETEAMRAGKALHRALELSSGGLFQSVTANGYTFRFGDIDIALELPAVRELKATRDYRIDGTVVTLVGQVDAVEGNRVEDHKTTSRFDPERFMDSFQWRAYLDIFDADHFRWNIFEMGEADPFVYDVWGFHVLDQRRYPELRADVERELLGFLRFAREHLPERFA